MLDHANQIEEQLATNRPEARVVTLSLNDDVYHRSCTWARVQLGISLLPE